MELRETDFAALADFPLAWRWAGASRDPLAPAVPTALRPLTGRAAAAFAPEGTARCAEGRAVDSAVTIAAEEDHAEAVRARLRALGIAGPTAVVVSWDARTAAATTWATFVAHWPALCYPSSDDVTVWSPGAPWTLCYRHYRVFEFGPAAHAAERGAAADGADVR